MKFSKILIPTLFLTGISTSCLSISSCSSTSECTVTFQESIGYILGGQTSSKVKKGTLFKDVTKPEVKTLSGYTWNNAWSLNDNDVIEKDCLVTAIVESDEIILDIKTTSDCGSIIKPSKPVLNEDLPITIQIKNNKALLNDTSIKIGENTYTLNDPLIQTDYDDKANDSYRQYRVVIRAAAVINKNITIELKTGEKIQPTSITVTNWKTNIEPTEVVTTKVSFAPTTCTEKKVEWYSSKPAVVSIEGNDSYKGGDVAISGSETSDLYVKSTTCEVQSASKTISVSRNNPETIDIPSSSAKQVEDYYVWSSTGAVSVSENKIYSFTVSDMKSKVKTPIWFEFYPTPAFEKECPIFVDKLTTIDYVTNSNGTGSLTYGSDFKIDPSENGIIWGYLTTAGKEKINSATSLTIKVLTQCRCGTYTNPYLFNLYSGHDPR